MTNSTDKVYQFQSLSNYTFKQRVIIHILGWLLYVVINAIGRTLKFELQGPHTLDEIFGEYKGMILCLWHDRLFTGAYYARDRRVIVLTSQSFDAEYAARCARRFGFGVVRGSSTRGGRAALVKLAKLAKDGIPSFFTVDGPRGPRHEAKPGAVQLAKVTGRPIIPGVLQPMRYWTINSWDKMQIPKPFSRIIVIKGDPIYVPPDADDGVIETKRLELQHSLDGIARQAKEWIEQKPDTAD